MGLPRPPRGPTALLVRLVVLAALLPAFLPSAVRAGSEDFFARVLLNGQEKGEMLLHRDDGGRFALREEDWNALGILGGGTAVAGPDGERLVPLSGVSSLRTAFDENTVTLSIDVEAASFPLYRKSLAPRPSDRVLVPDDNSAFLNYGINYSDGSGETRTSLPHELGVRRSGYLFLNRGSVEAGGGGGYRRYATSLVRDDRAALARFVAGDAEAATGDLGSSFSLAGISYLKDFRMEPSLQVGPTAKLSGGTPFPAELTVYVDNVQVAHERIPPGPFEIRDLSYYGGAGTVRAVVRDPFGREEVVATPFYFTDEVLRKGLHQFAYHAGVMREAGGDGAGGYGDGAFSFRHRVGVTDRLTLGGRAEGAGSRFNLGGTGAAKARFGGVVGGAVAAGTDGEGGFGVAARVAYAYQERNGHVRLSLEGRTPGYGTAVEEAAGRTMFRTSLGGGYAFPGRGSVSAEMYSVSRYDARGASGFSLSGSRHFRKGWSLQGGFRRTKSLETVDEFHLLLTVRLGEDRHAFTRVSAGDGGNREEVDVRKVAPLGEGYGYGLRASRESADAGDSVVVAPSGQYNGRTGTISADYAFRSGTPSADALHVGAAGSVLLVGDEIAFSRPVTDSFALVTVGDLRGIRVFQNGQAIGRSDERGRVVLPNLSSYYENQIGLDDREVPIEYRIGELSRRVSPPFRSGSVVPFDVARIQAVTGFLDIITGGGPVPAEYLEARIDGAAEPVPTGKGGEFYVENLPVGVHEGTVERQGRSYRFRLVVPESKEFIVELGRIACEAAP